IALIPQVSHLPVPAIAGLIILIAWRLIDFRQIHHIVTTSTAESMVLGFTILSVVIVNLELAIFGGIILSLCIFLRRTMQTDVPISAPDPARRYRSFVNTLRPSIKECPQ